MSKKRGPKPIKRNSVILALRNKKAATSRELGVSTPFLFTLLNSGAIKRAGKVEKDGRGRPETLWSLSRRGQGIALNLSKNN